MEKIIYDIDEDILEVMRKDKPEEAFQMLCGRYPEATVRRIRAKEDTELDGLLVPMCAYTALRMRPDFFKKEKNGTYFHDSLLIEDINWLGMPEIMVESGNHEELKRRELSKHYQETGEVIPLGTPEEQIPWLHI